MEQQRDKLSVRQPAGKSTARIRRFSKSQMETLIYTKKHVITHIRLFSK